MKNILVVLFWVVYSAQAAVDQFKVFSLEALDEAVKAVRALAPTGGSVGTDEFNECVFVVYGDLVNFVCCARDLGSYSIGEKDMRHLQDSVREKLFWSALLENKKLKNPSALVKDQELSFSLCYYRQAMVCIARIDIFRNVLQKHNILAQKFPTFETEAAKHIEDMVQTPPFQYLINYVEQEEKAALSAVVGEYKAGVMKGEPLMLIPCVYESFANISGTAVGSCSDLARWRKKVCELWWQEACVRFMPYVYVDNVLPGIVRIWIKDNVKDAKMADYWLYMTEDYCPFAELDDFKKYDSWPKILAALKTLAPMYNKEKNSRHEQILVLLAERGRADVSSNRDFVKKMFPQIVQSIKGFSTLSPDQKKRVLAAFCSPHLNADSPEITGVI